MLVSRLAAADGMWRRALHEEALELSRAAGNRSYEAVNLSALAHAVYLECDYEKARALAEQSLAILSSDKWGGRGNVDTKRGLRNRPPSASTGVVAIRAKLAHDEYSGKAASDHGDRAASSAATRLRGDGRPADACGGLIRARCPSS